MDIVFASHNLHKLLEVEAIMREVWPELRLVGPDNEAPPEDGKSFEENALIKARAGFQSSGRPCLADDSGICVDALGGKPGIDSAHFSGSRDDSANVEALLEQMRGVENRGAEFVCAAALVDADGETVLERRWRGKLSEEVSGAGGFGYDPVFIPEGLQLTAAQLSPEEKNSLSHRGQAFRAMAALLRSRYGA